MKKIFSLFLCLLMVVLLSGCHQPSSKRVNIVTSFYPMYIIAMNLTDGIDDVSITNMAENHTGCLHDFQIQSEDMKRIENANAFIINGVGMESFLKKITDTYPDLPIIDSSVGVELIYAEHDHEEQGNPHIWVSIGNYIQQVKNICDGLVSIDSNNETKYRENEKNYIKRLENLRDKMHRELDSLPNRDIITFHEAFPYFAKEFNLNIVAVINREPESEPSVKEISDTIEIVRGSGIKALFAEPQYPDTSAKAIAEETDAKIYNLDPASSGENTKDAYIDIMENNLKVLKEALA